MFEIYKSKNTNNWHWRLRADNHEILCSGEPNGFASKQKVIQSIEVLTSLVLITKTEEDKFDKHWKVWQSEKSARWNWHLKAANNWIICHGQPTGFSTRSGAEKSIKAIMRIVIELLESGNMMDYIQTVES